MLEPNIYYGQSNPGALSFPSWFDELVVLMKHERAKQVYYRCRKKHPKIAERIKKKYRIQTETDMSVALGFCLLATQKH